MDYVQNALVELAKALEADLSLAQTIAFVERDFAHALGAQSIVVDLGGETEITQENVREVSVDLMLDARTFGRAIFCYHDVPSQGQRDRARDLGTAIAVTIAWRARTNERDRLFQLVRTDALTALPNRLALDERLSEAWRRGHENGTTIALALLDIDYFKLFNDTHGHQAGDDCLRAVGERLAESATRVGGFVARYGGEEFAFIAEGVGAMQSVEALGRVLHAFELRPIVHEGSTLGRVSFSAGLASGTPRASRSIADFLAEADRALYRAKALGRNRICSGDYASVAPIVSRRARKVSGPPVFEDETVGREADTVRVVAALRNARLVSLVGPPGIGKSRLARVAAHAVRQYMSDGVTYVDLSLLTHDTDPYVSLAAALDIAIESSHIASSVREALRERNALIVLDNVPTKAAAQVAVLCDDLLSTAPDLAILATSRSAIGATEERTMVIAGLSLDASVELLRLRSGSTDLAELRKSVRSLGGVPAAIENVFRFASKGVPEELDVLEGLSR